MPTWTKYQGGSFRMLELLTDDPAFGFPDVKAYTSEDGETIIMVEFESADRLEAWRKDPTHMAVIERGRTEFLDGYWTGELVMRTTWDRLSGRMAFPGGPAS